MKKYKFCLFAYLIMIETGCAKENQPFIKYDVFTYENDSVFGDDGYYSNGLQLEFSTKYSKKNNGMRNYSFGIGQKIYTPKDIEIETPVLDDRPYAGYLYAFVNKNIYHSNIMDTFGISFGVTGKNSFADDIQTKIHDMIGSPKPMGWDYQTENEVLFAVSFMRSAELLSPMEMAYDWQIMPKIAASLGTPVTNIVPSIEFRYGYNLEHDFLSNKISHTPQEIIINGDKSYYIFLEMSPKFVLYNTFLDKHNIRGNRFNIEREWFQYEIIGGFTFRYKKYYLKTSAIFMSKEFKEQDNPQVIFSLKIGYLF